MMKTTLKWTKWFSISLLSLVLLLVIFIGTVLFTHPGLKLALWGAEKALPQLKVEEIKGSLFPRFALHNVSFVDESLNVDAKVERLTLAINFRCFFDPKVCVDELALQGVNFQMPELPPSEEPVEETPPLRSISTPVPIFVNKVSLNNINLNILGNKIDWQDFSTALSMQGDRLVIAPTALKVINVALASTDETPKEDQSSTTAQATAVDELGSAASNQDDAAKTSKQAVKQKEKLKNQDVAVKKEAENKAAKAESEPKGIVLPEVWIPLTIEAQRLDIHDFKLAGDTPVIVHHLGLEAKAGGDKVEVKTLELDMPEVEGKLSTQVTLSGDYPIQAQIDALVKQADVKGQKLSLSASGSVGDLSLQATLSDLVKAKIEGQIQPLKTELPFDIKLNNVEAQWPLSGKSDYQVSVPSLAAKGSLEATPLH